MHSNVRESGDGAIPMVSLDTVVERCGGPIDLFRSDCAGLRASLNWSAFISNGTLCRRLYPLHQPSL
jgi:hypothetical protein